MSRLIAARVRGGVIVTDVSLPEGTEVTVAVNDDVSREIELTDAERTALDEAITDADRAPESELVTTRALLSELDRIHPDHKA